jgi:hypothetical protein
MSAIRFSTSARAIAYMSQRPIAMEVSSLVLYEFRQSVQFQIFRHEKDRTHDLILIGVGGHPVVPAFRRGIQHAPVPRP